MYDPHLWPERRVLVMCDFCATPTWTAEGYPANPDTLPIGEDLAADLWAWFRLYDAQSTSLEEGEEDPNALTPDWHRTGLLLACRLRLELPAGWTVTYHDEEALWRGMQTADDTIPYRRVVGMEEAIEALKNTAGG